MDQSGTRLGAAALGQTLGWLPIGELVSARGTTDGEHLIFLVIDGGLAPTDRVSEVLWREVRALRTGRHAAIAHAISIEQDGARLMVVYEHPAGQPLTTLLTSGTALTIEQTALLVHHLADGLDRAHRRGFAHGMLAPSTIWVAADGLPTLVGLGLAVAFDTAGASRAVVGRMEQSYVAPEQVDARLNQKSADRYALGALAFTLLTGAPPTSPVHDEGQSPTEPADTSKADLASVLRRQLSRDPSSRYPTARAFADDLTAALSLPPIETLPTSVRSQPDQRAQPALETPTTHGPEAVTAQPTGAVRARPDAINFPASGTPPRRPTAQVEDATPAMLAALRAELAGLPFAMFRHIVILIGVLGFALVCIRAVAGTWTPNGVIPILFAIFGLVLVVVLVGSVFERHKLMRDLKQRQVVRVRGSIRPTRIRGENSSTYAMYLADGQRLYIEHPLYDRLMKASVEIPREASVVGLMQSSTEYRTMDATTLLTPHNRLLLEIVSDDGEVIFRHAAYRP